MLSTELPAVYSGITTPMYRPILKQSVLVQEKGTYIVRGLYLPVTRNGSRNKVVVAGLF